MKSKNVLLALFLIAVNVSSFAQSNLLNAKTPDQIGKKTSIELKSDDDKPLPYGYVNDRDILKSKTVFEIIDLDEKVNFPLYYPVDTTNIGKDRRSLFDVLLKNIKAGKITEVYSDAYFNTKKSYKDLVTSFTFIDTTDSGKEEINNNYDLYYPSKTPKFTYKTVKVKKGKKMVNQKVKVELPVAAPKKLDEQFINKQELTSRDITSYKIKGLWYFDKRQSELKYRLLGICPLAPEARELNSEIQDVIELFWIYFPAVRDILHEAKTFNDKNSALPMSFDQILNSRRFSSVIYKEENIFGDREIANYMKGNALNQLLEAERVKNKIRDFEHDMWNY
jgi:gliding motility associated protien GldN